MNGIKNLSLLNDNQEGGNNKKMKTARDLKLKPKNSISKNYIILEFSSLSISQCEYSEGPVGLTLIRCKRGMRVYKEIRGGWPGYIDCLATNDKQRVAGINVVGDSKLDLKTTTGIILENMIKTKHRKMWDYCGAVVYSKNIRRK